MVAEVAEGGGGTSTRPERPERVRLGDYLANVQNFDQADFETINRFGPSGRYGSGDDRRINFGQDISGLSAAELQELVLDVLDAQGVAFDRLAEEEAAAAIAEAEAREERLAEILKRQLEELERMGRQPCPPVEINAPVITEKEVTDFVLDIVDIVTPEARSPLTGATGISTI